MTEPAIEKIASVLLKHQRFRIQDCACGWADLGKSHAEHVAQALVDAGAATDDDALWPRIREAIYATTVSRADVETGWPECHRKNCQQQHSTPDEAFLMFVQRVAESVHTELICKATSEPDHGDEE